MAISGQNIKINSALPRRVYRGDGFTLCFSGNVCVCVCGCVCVCECGGWWGGAGLCGGEVSAVCAGLCVFGVCWVWVCVCVSVCVCVCVCVRPHMRMCMCVSVCAHVCIYAYVSEYVSKCVCVRERVKISVCSVTCHLPTTPTTTPPCASHSFGMNHHGS